LNKDKDSAEYKEALSIIQSGKDSITSTPRGDYGENSTDITIPPRDAQQQEKYDSLKNIEIKMRNAIVNKEKLFDK
jgi:hypothetical protein